MAIKRPAIAAGTELFRAWVNDETARPADGHPSLFARRVAPAVRNRVKVSPHRTPSRAFSFDRLAGTSACVLTRAAPDARSADKNRIGPEEVFGACTTHIFAAKASFRRLRHRRDSKQTLRQHGRVRPADGRTSVFSGANEQPCMGAPVPALQTPADYFSARGAQLPAQKEPMNVSPWASTDDRERLISILTY